MVHRNRAHGTGGHGDPLKDRGENEVKFNTANGGTSVSFDYDADGLLISALAVWNLLLNTAKPLAFFAYSSAPIVDTDA